MADICVQFFRTLGRFSNLFQHIFSSDNSSNNLIAICYNSGGFVWGLGQWRASFWEVVDDPKLAWALAYVTKVFTSARKRQVSSNILWRVLQAQLVLEYGFPSENGVCFPACEVQFCQNYFAM